MVPTGKPRKDPSKIRLGGSFVRAGGNVTHDRADDEMRLMPACALYDEPHNLGKTDDEHGVPMARILDPRPHCQYSGEPIK